MIETAPRSHNIRPFHVAVIMDGNGRWARSRGLLRYEGHRAGATTARRIVEAAAEREIGILTLFAFSADNWKRPPQEVHFLMQLLRRFLRLERDRCVREGIRLQVIGSRRRIPAKLASLITDVERVTAGGRRMLLRIAVDYSSRDAILHAARRLNGDTSREAFSRALGEIEAARDPAPAVDLLIRTGGEKRLSDFLLWECAYAELYFTDTMWPEFAEEELDRAVEDYARRERRFGTLRTEVPA